MTRKNILIIDDEVDLAKIAKLKLEAAGYNVILATSGDDGMNAALKEKPGLIFLDVMMPRKDGFETLRELRSDTATLGIPVIMLTVMDDTRAMLKAKEIGASDYLIKGDWEELEKFAKRYAGEQEQRKIG